MATTRPTRPVRAAMSSPQQSTPIHSRRLVVLSAAVLAMVVAAGAVWIGLGLVPNVAKMLPVRQVVFVSATGAPLMEIDGDNLKRVADALQTRGALMLQLDLAALKDGMKQIAWVRDANVRRQFPSTIVVAIEEHKPTAAWSGINEPKLPVGETETTLQSKLVNSYGEVFRAEISDERKLLLPQLHGPEGATAEMLEKYAEILTPLGTIGRAPKTLTLTARRAWQISLDNGSQLLLGRVESERRLQRFIQAYPQVAGLQRAHAEVDLRYQGGFAIRGDEAAKPAGKVADKFERKKSTSSFRTGV